MQEPVLKRDLARRDGLRGDIAALENLGALPREAVLLIHGTSANKAASPPAWWLPDSDFCRKLNSALSQQGSAARCWAHIGNGKSVFSWTGDNLETERRIGGDRLAKEITDLEASRDFTRYHIVAHSHGGNVVLRALRALAVDPEKLGAVIFLGTPVLAFSDRASWLTRRTVEMLFYGMGLAISVTMALLAGKFQLVSIMKLPPELEGSNLDFLWYVRSLRRVSILFAVAFGCLLLDGWWTKSQRRLPIYGSGHAHAFEFAHDEAMETLRLAMQFAQRSREFLKQLFGTKAPPDYAVDPQRPKFWSAVWLDFKKSHPYQLYVATGLTTLDTQGERRMKIVERLVFYFGKISRAARSSSTTPVRRFVSIYATILLFMYLFIFIIAPITLLMPWITGWNPGLKLFYITGKVEDLQEVLIDLTYPFFVIAGILLIVMIFGSFLSELFAFVRLGMAWARQLFFQFPGAWMMGRVVRNAAFGGPCKKVLRPAELPKKERARSEAISQKLTEKMDNLSRGTAAQAGEALYSALAEGDAMRIKDHVRERLADSKLAHCQYYCEGEIINRIAELIAAPDSIHPSEAAC